jgi:hypothetical protein
MLILGQNPTKVVPSKCPLCSHPPVFYLSDPVDILLVAIILQGVFHLGEKTAKAVSIGHGDGVAWREHAQLVITLKIY